MAKRSRMLVLLLGNVVFGVLGLVIGYFVLVQIRPDMNVLGLKIPQVEDIEIPQVPENWPRYDWDPSKHFTPPGDAVEPMQEAVAPVPEA